MGFEEEKASAGEVRQVAGQLLLGRLEAFVSAALTLADAAAEEDDGRAMEIFAQFGRKMGDMEDGQLYRALLALSTSVGREIVHREDIKQLKSGEANAFPFAGGLVPSQN